MKKIMRLFVILLSALSLNFLTPNLGQSKTIIGFDKEHAEYFAPDEIFVFPQIDVGNDKIVSFDANFVCKKFIEASNQELGNKVKVSCSGWEPKVTTAHNLFIILKIRKVNLYPDPHPENIDHYEISLVSERHAFGVDAPRYSLSEGVIYKVVPYQGQDTENELKRNLNAQIMNFLSQVKQARTK